MSYITLQDQQSIADQISTMPDKDFDFVYRRIARHQSYIVCASVGIRMMTDTEKYDLHRFLCEHHIKVNREIRDNELECAVNSIKTRHAAQK